MVFDGPGAKLPVATLRPSAHQPRRRVLAGQFDRWLALRWAWVRPRIVPLLAAGVGFLVTVGAVKYVSVYAYSDSLVLEMRARLTEGPPRPPVQPPCNGAHLVAEPEAEPPTTLIQFVVKPIKPGDRYIELTLEPTEPR